MSEIKEEFFSRADRELLEFNHLGSFVELWEAELEWFEPPNYRRSGWSGAARHELRQADGGRVGVFIKRQENHLRRTLRYPKGGPTFRVEWENLKKLDHFGIPAPRPLFYGERFVDGRPQAVLVTYALDGYLALDDYLRQLGRSESAGPRRRAVLKQLAANLRRLHDHRFRHNCLYPKHILLQAKEGNFDVRLIDLEKSRRVFSPLGARIRDLDTMLRRCPEMSAYEKDLLLNFYLEAGLDDLDAGALAEALGRYPLVRWVKKRIAAKKTRPSNG